MTIFQEKNSNQSVAAHEHFEHNVPYIRVEKSEALDGEVSLYGAKNAVLVIMISLILTRGKSILRNVPVLDDVLYMIKLLEELGAIIDFDQDNNILLIDTNNLDGYQISAITMKKTRASILALGPLLARFGRAEIALPGGDVIGARPIDYHLKNFEKMGVVIIEQNDQLLASVKQLIHRNLLLEYPSVGATENLLMAAVLTDGMTKIINAAFEPEVFDLVSVLQKMGANITYEIPVTIVIIGVKLLYAIDHTVIFDRLEAGSLLLAGAITGGYVSLPQAPAHAMGLVLMKLQEMGHSILIGNNGIGVKIRATKNPHAISLKTAPYPGFPTDLQAPFIAALTISSGTSIVQETVYENRLNHVRELVKMGAQITVDHDTAIVRSVDELFGTHVIAGDIRASCSLVLAGLAAEGTTIISGLSHWKRGYQSLDQKLRHLGALITIHSDKN